MPKAKHHIQLENCQYLQVFRIGINLELSRSALKRKLKLLKLKSFLFTLSEYLSVIHILFLKTELFLISLSLFLCSEHIYKNFLYVEFQRRISGVGSDHFANCATTTAPVTDTTLKTEDGYWVPSSITDYSIFSREQQILLFANPQLIKYPSKELPGIQLGHCRAYRCTQSLSMR